MRRITVVIADRYPVVLQGLSNVLGAHSDFKIVATCNDGPGCVEAIRNLAPDIAILDGSMPGVTGPEILSIVNAENLPRGSSFSPHLKWNVSWSCQPRPTITASSQRMWRPKFSCSPCARLREAGGCCRCHSRSGRTSGAKYDHGERTWLC